VMRQMALGWRAARLLHHRSTSLVGDIHRRISQPGSRPAF
jgi:hypothetical protein